MDHTSYLGIIVILILTGCGLPLPEEAPIVAAGVASSGENPTLNPWMALASCIIGALMGDSVIYALGYHFGRNLISKHPRLAILLHAEREAMVEEKMRRHGMKVLFASRFMVGVRAPVYLTAGILRMPYLRFLAADSICATAVVSLFFGLSYMFGPQIKRLVKDFEVLVTVVAVLAGIALAIYLWRKSRLAMPTLDPQAGATTVDPPAADASAANATPPLPDALDTAPRGENSANGNGYDHSAEKPAATQEPKSDAAR